MAKKLIPDQIYEARISAVQQFYAEYMHRTITKEEACPVHMSTAQYMKVTTFIFILFCTGLMKSSTHMDMSFVK